MFSRVHSCLCRHARHVRISLSSFSASTAPPEADPSVAATSSARARRRAVFVQVSDEELHPQGNQWNLGPSPSSAASQTTAEGATRAASAFETAEAEWKAAAAEQLNSLTDEDLPPIDDSTLFSSVHAALDPAHKAKFDTEMSRRAEEETHMVDVSFDDEPSSFPVRSPVASPRPTAPTGTGVTDTVPRSPNKPTSAGSVSGRSDSAEWYLNADPTHTSSASRLSSLDVDADNEETASSWGSHGRRIPSWPLSAPAVRATFGDAGNDERAFGAHGLADAVEWSDTTEELVISPPTVSRNLDLDIERHRPHRKPSATAQRPATAVAGTAPSDTPVRAAVIVPSKVSPASTTSTKLASRAPPAAAETTTANPTTNAFPRQSVDPISFDRHTASGRRSHGGKSKRPL
jgi:hypothetical protein